MGKTICPFCKSKHNSLRGDGCCYCEYTGLISYGDGLRLRTKEESENHNPEVSLFDLERNRASNRDPNFKPF